MVGTPVKVSVHTQDDKTAKEILGLSKTRRLHIKGLRHCDGTQLQTTT